MWQPCLAFFFTKYCDVVVTTTISYLGVPPPLRFMSRRRAMLDMFVRGFLSPSKQLLRQNFKRGRGRFLPCHRKLRTLDNTGERGLEHTIINLNRVSRNPVCAFCLWFPETEIASFIRMWSHWSKSLENCSWDRSVYVNLQSFLTSALGAESFLEPRWLGGSNWWPSNRTKTQWFRAGLREWLQALWSHGFACLQHSVCVRVETGSCHSKVLTASGICYSPKERWWYEKILL